MATLTLRTQSTGIRPQFEVASQQGRRALQTPDESMVARARQVNQRPLRRVDLNWDSTNRGQRELLERAWQQAADVRAMNYTPVGDIDANAFEVHFLSEPTIEQISPTSWQMSASVEEVL
jgi:hypothetical protein